MVAVLKPIETRALQAPTYDNTHVKSFSWWMDDNLPALRGYYAELGRTLPQGEDDNLTGLARAQQFLGFIQCQWDKARGAF